MSDFNLDFETDNKQISIDNTTPRSETSLNVTQELEMSLLANSKNSKPSDGGYSSGGEDTKVEGTKVEDTTKKEDFSFFQKEKTNNTDDEKDKVNYDEIKNISVPPEDDPLINSLKGGENRGDYKPLHAMNAQEIKNEKIDLIYKFKKLEGQGIRTTINYNMNSQLEDMRNEYIKLKKQREVANSVKLQRKVMMAIITGAEFMNNRFDPFNVKLDGWSESINENIYDYDEVFEELAEKYGGKSEMAPEIKLLMMVVGSGFMFHLTNTMFKSSIPGMDDIMKQNPDLMKQFAKAAVGSIGKQPGGGMGGMEQPNRSPPPRNTSSRNQSVDTRGGNNTVRRPEMSGPQNVDQIINQMNLQPNDIPDLDNISIVSGESDRGFTLNL